MTEKIPAAQKAVIYCRVSSKKQSTDGAGLESQEHRCREYAESKGYHVEAVFPDDTSGGGDFMNRPGMVALLAYLDAKPQENYVVIFDDLKRYARDTEFHLKLTREMAQRNAKRECLNFNFEDTPEGKFIETIIAAQGELERKQNRRQVIQKMKARVEQGFWIFRAPVGYKYINSKRGGKELIIDEPVASTVRQALEGFASGRLNTQFAVRKFLEECPHFPKDLPNGEVRRQTVVRVLRQVAYAGFVQAPNWNVKPRLGNHEPLISYETYTKIQNILDEGVYAPQRKDLHHDFPLRGAVCCSSCSTPMTAGWSKGKTKSYPYFWCRTKGCDQYGKVINRDKMETEFKTLLKGIQPTPSLLNLFKTMFNDAYEMHMAQAQDRLKAFKQESIDLEKQIAGLVERVMDASSQTVIAAYESKIDLLEKKRLVALEKSKQRTSNNDTQSNLFELSFQFLANPCKIWESGRFDLQRLVLKLVFLEHLPYTKGKGFLNSKKSLPFNVLGDFSSMKCQMVLPERFELSTSPLPRECSTPELRQQSRLWVALQATDRDAQPTVSTGMTRLLPQLACWCKSAICFFWNNDKVVHSAMSTSSNAHHLP
ncbi:site-specific recombinase [Roseibium sp. TrichSKD4]|nr:site-specific recombinase [Roseibium sp. TrichSKD4]